MSETIRFTGGHNGAATPLELFVDTADRSEGFEFPGEAIRLEVLKEVLDLCKRFDPERDSNFLASQGLFRPPRFQTPATEYVSPRSGRTASVVLISTAITREEPQVRDWWVRLRARSGKSIDEELYQLSADVFKCQGVAGTYNGSRGELNIFRGIVDAIRSAHFPKAK